MSGQLDGNIPLPGLCHFKRTVLQIGGLAPILVRTSHNGKHAQEIYAFFTRTWNASTSTPLCFFLLYVWIFASHPCSEKSNRTSF